MMNDGPGCDRPPTKGELTQWSMLRHRRPGRGDRPAHPGWPRAWEVGSAEILRVRGVARLGLTLPGSRSTGLFPGGRLRGVEARSRRFNMAQDGHLLDGDDGAGGDFQVDFSVSDLMDSAVQAGSGDDPVARLQGILHLDHFFLPLILFACH